MISNVKRIILLMSVLLYSVAANALVWPVINNITITPSGNSWIYSFGTTFQDFGGVEDPLLYNSKAVMLGHLHYGSSTDTNPNFAAYDTANGQAHEKGGKSYGILASQLARDYYNEWGKSATILHSGRTPGPDECIAYYITASGNYHATPGSVYIPSGMCARVPPVNTSCKITSPQLVFDHGTISLEDAEGNTVTDNLSVSCTQPMKITLRLTANEPYIYLTPSGKSQITINDKPLGSSFDLPGGISTLTVKDYLTGVTVGGQYIGSSVLVMSPY